MSNIAYDQCLGDMHDDAVAADKLKWQMAPDIIERLNVSTSSALSSALSIYLCQIRVHQTLTV